MTYKVELQNIHKSFGGICALHDVTLKVRPGEIHAIVGENGAGKSTLMKILAGSCQMDRGEIYIDRKRVRIQDPRAGRELGVGIIYQEFALVPDLSVAENISLHFLKQDRFWMPWRELQRRADEWTGTLGFEISSSRKVRDLSTSQQQVVEIAKALSENADVLILDEPTAVLAPGETRKLFEVLEKLKEKGVTILYISHRLEEIFRIADTVTVLKDGKVTVTCGIADMDHDRLITAMIGRKLDTLFPARISGAGKTILDVKNIRHGKRVRDISFSVRQGEVLGIAGLVGSGRTETLRAVFSADRRERGEILINGKKIHLRSPRDAVRSGLGLVPEDRKRQGVLLSLPIRQNLTITDLHAITGKSGIIREKRERLKSKDLIRILGIRAKGIDERVAWLSGGNQQKVVLAKWLGRNCKVLLMDEPTRGIDVGAKTEIYRLINDLAGKGLGIVMVSSEMIELMGMCDRILVMHEGKINGELKRVEFSEEALMRLSIAKNKAYDSEVNAY